MSPGGLFHPSNNFGAVLAAAEQAGASGEEFMLALAVSYEIQCRFTAVVPVMVKGFNHATQLAMSVAAAAGQLFGLSAEQIANAISIATADNVSLACIHVEPVSQWKGFSPGWTGMRAVYAASMAKRGFTGPRGLFEGPMGLNQVFGPIPVDWDDPSLDFVTQTVLKKYCSLIHGQPVIEATLDVKRSYGVQAPRSERSKIMKILMVLTSHDKLGNTGRKTGFWLEEFAAPYYTFLDAGATVTVASPKGGQPPLDPVSDTPEGQTDLTQRFKQDPAAQAVLANTVRLRDVKASDYDAVFYPGGHGPMWDLAEDPRSIALIEAFYSTGKPVAAVCHAPGVLHRVQFQGQPIVKGKRVTGFTNGEEDAVHLTKVVPFLVEDELKRLGGLYEKVEKWKPFVVTDGRLVTGQNPASSTAGAEALLKLLSPDALTPARFIDRFEQIGGVHSGFRRNHAKGLGVSGFFESNGNGVRLSK